MVVGVGRVERRVLLGVGRGEKGMVLGVAERKEEISRGETSFFTPGNLSN